MTIEDDHSRSQELEALAAIYADELNLSPGKYAGSITIPIEPASPVTVTFTSPKSDEPEMLTVSHLPPMVMRFVLPEGYPEDVPPVVKLECRWLATADVDRVQLGLVRLWDETRDQSIYTYAEHVRDSGSTLFSSPSATPSHALSLTFGPSQYQLRDTFLSYDSSATAKSFNNTSFACSICLTNHKGSACQRLSACGHVFCKACLEDYYGVCIEEGMVSQVRCVDCLSSIKKGCAPSTTAKSEWEYLQDYSVPPSELVGVLSPEKIQRYKDMAKKHHFDADPTTIYCPRPSCNTPLPPSKDSEGMIDKLGVCPSCGYTFCTLCRETYHGPVEACKYNPANTASGGLVQDYLSADPTAQKLMERRYGQRVLHRLVALYEDEQLALRWLRDNSTPCPTCAVPVEKSMGCNHMICGRCGTHFCFLCGAYLVSRNPYGHYNVVGQGCYGRLFEGLTEEDERRLNEGAMVVVEE
ncbi:hypothetical protein G7K_2844-t1 [Saitoella complicata NRRL Y-17804]|uniref:RBR-type E3 ubiquitin transferase n=2 Tax=Saitoella complicata (strain BCRC 22490 / CBS 7301 / JCM 7358 / NBRC 10748 / NRRL Y-17804) TaxID=698492 RepID=A0A0E9NFQ9_SAICN|nr:hypothetical protein G7K_2844-t1 [Saitoella complicata NRRL Y-17804]